MFECIPHVHIWQMTAVEFIKFIKKQPVIWLYNGITMKSDISKILAAN